MPNPKPNRGLQILPWFLTLVLLGALVAFGLIYQPSNPFETQQVKASLLSNIQINMLQAIEAEKNAVLAVKPETAREFATQARKASDALDKERQAFDSISAQSKTSEELELFGEFNLCWAQFRKLDDSLLALATQGTNIRAKDLSAKQATDALEGFETSLKTLPQNNPRQNLLALEALNAALKIQILHKPHIEAASDQVMDQLETRIKGLDEIVRTHLTSLQDGGTAEDREAISESLSSYNRYMNITREVIKLSRQNTNLKSAEISLDKKRLISTQCQTQLSELQQIVAAQTSKASR